MKKLLFLAVISALALNAYAQQPTYPQLRIGLALGVNRTDYAPKPGTQEWFSLLEPQIRPLSTLRAEVGLWVRINSWLHLRTGTTWETKGVWLTEPFYGIDWQGFYTQVDSARIEYSYFTFPLMLEFGVGHKVRFYGGGGIYGGVKYRGAIRESGQRPMDVYLISFAPNATHKWNWFDWGVNAHTGLCLSVGASQVFLEGRFSRGLKRLENGGIEAGLHHLAYSVQAGVNFPLNLSKKPPYERFN
jgi:hypothetical protein